VYVADASAAEKDDDARVGQRELDAAVGLANPALKDRQSLRFLAVIGKEPDQVLRYARWQDSAPLWVAAAGQPARGAIPPCAHCGAPRAFEFQVMPQLLHYLRVDADAQMPGGRPGEAVRLAAMDWGTLAAYTCTKSCDVSTAVGGYVEEVLWRQEPMA
jgi:pre-rRNA-processing protein TSR4